MPWYFPWPDSIKKRACRYLLQHYLGHFLKEKLTLDQLTVDLYNGTGTIQDVSLDVASVNEVLENLNVPVEIVDGFVGRISVSIPWSALVSDNTNVEIHNLELTVQPRKRVDSAGVMLDSMFNSMTTSLQLAQECLKQEPTEGEQSAEAAAQPFEGLEMFAQTIEAVLSRVKVTFLNTIVRLEHLPKEAQMGAALEMRINRIEYFDDQAAEAGTSVDPTDQSGHSVYEPAAIAHKNFNMMGVSLYCDEFPASHRTVSKSTPQSGYDSFQSASETPLSPLSPLTAMTQHPVGLNLQQDEGKAESDHSSKDQEPIKIAVLTGKTEFRMKIKQKEELAGPKLELEGQFGSINLHLSPRQVHLLLEIGNGLASPGLCDDSNVRPRASANKPMQADDFAKVERELQKQIQQSRLQQVHHKVAAWQGGVDEQLLATQSLDDSDEEGDEYYDLGSHSEVSSMEASFSSGVTSKSATTTATGVSSFSPASAHSPKEGSAQRHAGSSQGSSRARQRANRAKDMVQKMLEDPTADLTRYKLRVSFLSVILLHSDPPNTPSDDLDPGPTSAEKLKDMSDKYFGRVQGISTMGMGISLVDLRAKYSEACPFDHIGILGKPITMECNQKSSASLQSMTADVTVGLLEVVEAVFDRRGATASFMGFHLPIENILPEYCELLTFQQDAEPRSGMYTSTTVPAASPCLKVKVQTVERIRQSSRRATVPPETKVHIELGKCQSEVDITIVDRVHGLLNPQPLAETLNPQQSLYRSAAAGPASQLNHSYFNQAMDEGPSASDRRIDFTLSGCHCTCIIRFPIPDLRGGQGMDKPWWRRCLRRDALLVELTDAKFHTLINSDPLQKYEVTCRHAHGLWQESANHRPQSFIHISTGDDSQDGFDWPRFVIKLFPKTESVLDEVLLDSDDSIPPYDSLNGACQFSKAEPSPFSSKKVMNEFQEMVMPADRQEMNDFQTKATSNTRMTLELTLPNVNACLPSKDFFELIYNRLINDLVLWEPQAPSPVDTNVPHSLRATQPWIGVDLSTQLRHQFQLQEEAATGGAMGTIGCDRFTLCKSAIQYNAADSSSDSEESLQTYSQKERQLKMKIKQRQDRLQRQSKMCVTLNITRGRLTACPAVKDEADKVIEEQHGKFVLDIEDGNLFTVVNYNADPELQYLCLQSHKASLYHKGCLFREEEPAPPLGRTSLKPPENLHPTIYLSDSGVVTKLSGQVGLGGDTLDQLSVAVKIKVDRFVEKKEYLVAVGVRGSTLQHRMSNSGYGWFEQLVEFFNVNDYPILGYTMPKIVTELHLHLWGCALDYRPLYLPIRAMVTMEAFSISSNIIADSPTSLLRFLLDDGALYLSDNCKDRPVDLKRHYVCVVDVGLFELSLRSSDGRDPKYPKLDLRMSSNILHLRTCYDSCRAMADLINYVASDGDLSLDAGLAQDLETKLQQQQSGDGSSLSESPKMTQSSIDQVHDMMADAMRESSVESSSSNSSGGDRKLRPGSSPSTQVFFKSGKDGVNVPIAQSPVSSPTLSTSAQEVIGMEASRGMTESESEENITSSTMSEDTEQFSAEEEFCIIDDPGLGISPRSGEPRIRCLTSDPVVVKDDHFKLPLGKMDQLKSPEHFPCAVYRYTLREISAVWHMYGGRDFDSSPPSRSEKLGAHMARTGAKRRSKDDGKHMGHLGWRARGGRHRNVDILMELQLNKLRMQYESFPENTEQASRQIILVHEVELRDRLASSKINKFLYRYTSENMPRQTHANMLLIKALHARPDPNLPSQECSMKVSVQPLRLNIDQDALFFLRTFFKEIAGAEEEPQPSRSSSRRPSDSQSASSKSKAATPPPPPQPIMQVGQPLSATPPDNPDLIMFDEMDELEEGEEEEEEGEVAAKSQPTFFKTFIFSPEVPIRLDYQGKRVDMEQGTFAGLLVGLAQLNCSELRLKRLHHRHGLLGTDRLVVFALNEWLQDVKKNQLPSILGGVGPLHSLVQLVQGLRDLVWLPVEQYRKDGRIVRGLQRGANSFMTCTAMSTLELTNRLVQTVQWTAEIAYGMVSPGPSIKRRLFQRRQRRLLQPADLREGVANAYEIVREGLQQTAENIVKVAVAEHEQKGVTGAVGGVLREIPPTALQPVIIATEATSNVLGGMRNQLLPDKKREDDEKWKPEES